MVQFNRKYVQQVLIYKGSYGTKDSSKAHNPYLRGNTVWYNFTIKSLRHILPFFHIKPGCARSLVLAPAAALWQPRAQLAR